MDYIFFNIRQQRNLYRSTQPEYSNLLKIEAEYACLFLLGYLWDKNIAGLDENHRERILEKLRRPPMGTIINICRELDLSKDFFSEENQTARDAINSYPGLRNRMDTHGYVFEDQRREYATELERLVQNLFDSQCILSQNFQIVLVNEVLDNYAKGIKFGHDHEFSQWTCATEVATFKPNNVYAMEDANEYTRLSPFIVVTREQQIYLFGNIDDRMSGRATYNQIPNVTGSKTYNWSDFTNISNDNSEDFARRRSRNGTILNNYENNFTEYIDIGIKKKIAEFLVENRSSVCGTVWGHGGVGKTATVQSICDDLSEEEEKKFDYIVFASAKDRSFNYITGTIAIRDDEPVNSYKNLMKYIKSTMGLSNTDEVNEITAFDGRLLIIIDDYETFPSNEQAQIETFIRDLNINSHKVLITTRANVRIGEEFATHEFGKPETVDFLVKVMESVFPDLDIPLREQDLLQDPEIQQHVFQVTSGRPLFIFQLAHVWGQTGKLQDALSENINTQEQAIEFLYGRIFNYLSREGKDIFRAISLLVTQGDLTNLVDKLQYIVNMENDNKFNQGLQELNKLKVIETYENGFFKVYSEEIVPMMRKEYNSASRNWRSIVQQRLQAVTQDQTLDTEQALLQNADASRAGRSREEVISNYRQVLNRDTSPLEIQSQAVRRLADYLFRNRKDTDAAIQVFRDFKEKFRADANVAKMYAHYCWHDGNQQEAIDVLMNFLMNRNRQPAFELLGLCVTFRSTYLTDRLENLKSKIRTGEIDERASETEKKEIELDINNLYDTQGNSLFQQIQAVNLRDLSGEANQNIVAGLYHLSDICKLSDRIDRAIEICEFALQGAKGLLRQDNQRKQFQKQLSSLQETSANDTSRVSSRQLLRQAHQNDMPIAGKVTGFNTGGLVVNIGGLRAFCPMSQIDTGYCDDPASYAGQTHNFKIVELRGRNNVVVSRRAYLEEENRKKADEMRQQLSEGEERTGTITRIERFGSFVDLGGVEGLVHVSEISHTRVENPRSVLKKGEEVRVKIIGLKNLGKKNERISLSIKALEKDPWDTVAERYQSGSIITGKVVSIQNFGAFVEIEPGIEGLIHISQFVSGKRISNPSEVVSVGQEVKVLIREIDLNKKRISLSMRAVEEQDRQTAEIEDMAAFKSKQTQESQSDNSMADALRRAGLA